MEPRFLRCNVFYSITKMVVTDRIPSILSTMKRSCVFP
jgi:hypothetical protein